MSSKEQAEKLPGVLWQGNKVDMDEIYHLLDDFVITLANNPTTMQLAMILHNEDGTTQQPIVMDLGDRVVLKEDSPWIPDEVKVDSIGIIKAERGMVQ